MTGTCLSDDYWRLASLGVAAGSLGSRAATEHAPATYFASFAACSDLCTRVWADCDPLDGRFLFGDQVPADGR